MKITHKESGAVYEITQQKESFKLHDYGTERSYYFKESYDAIWHVIELTRNISFDFLDDENLKEIARRAHLTLETVPKSLMSSIKKETLNRTYYDQIFMKLLTNYRAGMDEVVLSNKTNFVVDHEVGNLLKSAMGIRLSIPSV